MKYEFEWYDPNLGAPIVSLAEYGLTFNRAAVEMLSKAAKVMLGFDRRHKVIAVKPISEHDAENADRAIDFANRERNGYVRISSRDFIRFVARYCPEIDVKHTVRYPAIWDETNAAMLIDLNRPIATMGDEVFTAGSSG